LAQAVLDCPVANPGRVARAAALAVAQTEADSVLARRDDDIRKDVKAG
jgi:hypothetical protein